jgi:hypothetical protein
MAAELGDGNERLGKTGPETYPYIKSQTSSHLFFKGLLIQKLKFQQL